MPAGDAWRTIHPSRDAPSTFEMAVTYRRRDRSHQTDQPRDGDPRFDSSGEHSERHRRDAPHQPTYGRTASREPARQTWNAQPNRANPLRDTHRPDRTLTPAP